MINHVELFRDPLQPVKELVNDEVEMTEWQLSFLCGLIKTYCPRKIVEIGVAAGGTTAVMLSCVSMLGLDTEIYSIDVSERYYKDKNKATGYLVENNKKDLAKGNKYKLYRGGISVKYLEDIGDDIDFLILDTVHFLPGEILDFLACYPKLKSGAIVVLHDIIMNHLSDHINAFATKVLLCSAVGEKIRCKGDNNQFNSPGIGAFQITPDTGKYIENMFSALTITWNYMPDSVHIELYRRWFLQYYNDNLVEEFEEAIKMNQITMERKTKRTVEEIHSIYELLLRLKGRKNIFIYGCGELGVKLCNLLEGFAIRIEGYVISDDQAKPNVDRRVEFISDLESGECTLVLGMSLAHQREICRGDLPNNWIPVEQLILGYLKNSF